MLPVQAFFDSAAIRRFQPWKAGAPRDQFCPHRRRAALAVPTNQLEPPLGLPETGTLLHVLLLPQWRAATLLRGCLQLAVRAPALAEALGCSSAHEPSQSSRHPPGSSARLPWLLLRPWHLQPPVQGNSLQLRRATMARLRALHQRDAHPAGPPWRRRTGQRTLPPQSRRKGPRQVLLRLARSA